MSWILAIIGFGVLIFIHELGHFVFAKLVGVKVETFSIGFGPSIFKFQKGETLYQLSIIPFGGFCKLAGEDLNSEHESKPNEFYSKNPFQRILISLAGVLFNFIFAIMIFTTVNMMPREEIYLPPKIYIPEKLQSYPAYQSGLRTGAIIKEINGIKIENYNQIVNIIGKAFGNDLDIVFEYNGELKNIKVKPLIEKETGRSIIGIMNYIDTTITYISKDSPFNNFGISIGDKIIKVNGIEVITKADIYEELTKNIGKYAKFEILKSDGSIKNIDIFIVRNIDLGISLLPPPVKIKGMNLFFAFINSFKKMGETVSIFFKSLRLLFSGKVNINESVGGPIKIIYFSSEIAKTGIRNFLEFYGLLSIILVIMNLLPIPAVDGSYILFFLIELISGKPLNKKLIITIQSVGMILLFVLMGLVLFNDIMFFVKK